MRSSATWRSRSTCRHRLAARGDAGQRHDPHGACPETYAVGLRAFVDEARLLARFDHPSLVHVYRFWEDNATAYIVMPYLRGITLREARRKMARAPDEAWIRRVLDPVLDALALLHGAGVFHCDIAPDNILLPASGPAVLLDFGAARHAIGDGSQSAMAVLKPRYAPIEQHEDAGGQRQGPWTDLYALGAVVHLLLFGVPPSPATVRAQQDDVDAIAGRSVRGRLAAPAGGGGLGALDPSAGAPAERRRLARGTRRAGRGATLRSPQHPPGGASGSVQPRRRARIADSHADRRLGSDRQPREAALLQQSEFEVPSDRPHFAIWPKRLPRAVIAPETSLWSNLEVSALRFPDKAAYVFFGRELTYADLHAQALAVAGWLQSVGVQAGDRVAIFMQNCPQFAAAYYGILRANARRRPGQSDEQGRRVPPLHHRPRDQGRHLQRRSGRRWSTRPMPRSRRPSAWPRCW